MAIITDADEETVKQKQPAYETPPVQKEQEDEDGDVFYDSVDYAPEELERLHAEATEHKKAGNQHFASGDFEKAIEEYEQALTVCPLALAKERAIYFGNIAACHLKLSQYKDARDMATQALELDPGYTKVILRRAQANEKVGTYSALSDALDDYERLEDMAADAHTKRECARAKQRLPGLIKTRQEEEKEEMMGKLKDLGNTLLGKFGLSTDNFQLQQDPSSGGYSVNFVNK